MEIKIQDNVVHYDVVHPDGRINLIVLHGWGHSGALWKGVAQLLPNDICSYLIDLPGFGQSSLGKVASLSDYVTIISGFIAKLNLSNVRLLGHSFGGQIAVKIASQQSLQSLILVAPAISRERHSWNKTWYQVLAFLAKGKRILPLQWTYHLSSGLNYAEASPQLKLIFKNVIKIDVIQDLKKITTPTLCVWGERDREILGSAKTIVNQLQNGRLKVIYDAGHNLHLDRPKDLVRLIERYI